MLKIFEKIFRNEKETPQGCSEELINRAIERALDGTDARLRIISGYAKRMRPAVVHAVDHVIQLVDALSPPIPMSRADWSSQPLLTAMFSSAESLQSMLGRDSAFKAYAASHPHRALPLTAALLVRQTRKAIYGYDLIDDKAVSDAPLTVVSFDAHRLMGVAASEAETRRLLKLRAFDYLLALAKEKISASQGQWQDLVTRKKILRSKLDIFSCGDGSSMDGLRANIKANLQEKMKKVEAELNDMGTDDAVFERNMGLVIETLAAAGTQLRCKNEVVHIDNLHYLRAAGHPNAVALPLQTLRDANARELAITLVTVPDIEWPLTGA